MTIAAEGLRGIAEIYATEKDIRSASPGQRLSARRVRSAPLVAAFKNWLQAQRLRISSKPRLGEKLAYIHNCHILSKAGQSFVQFALAHLGCDPSKRTTLANL